MLLSSHLLAEVQATIDHLVVIRAGRIVAAGALADLLARRSPRSPWQPGCPCLSSGQQIKAA